jgi:CheY-like chemotaxis protein
MHQPFSPQASELTLLLVEDNVHCRELAIAQLSDLFKRVVVANDGIEGLERFMDCSPDIILTDQNMPGLSGLEMLTQIRKMDQNTPVILMTGGMDYQMLVQAINLGVTRFIPKPYKYELFLQTIDDVARKIVNELLLERHRQQEIELLRYRDRYNSMQQEAALRKEHHVVRHDIRRQAITAGEIRWGVEVAHTPRDIMCGDGYSVRRLPDGRVLIFLIDSMGSGLSASLTTLLATSFCNFIVEHLFQSSGFELQKILDLFMSYLPGMLLDDEVISCGFFLVDLKTEDMETALFALPPLLVRDLDGSVRHVRSANPPLSQYSEDTVITRLSLAKVADLLVVTDGVTDAPLVDEGVYREHMQNDFQASPTLAALQRRFRARISATVEKDDLTMLHLRRLDLPASWRWSCTLQPRLDSLGEAITQALEQLMSEVSLGANERDELELILTEALTNALEHGCLLNSREEKDRTILAGEYDNMVAHRTAPPDSNIVLTISLWRGAKQPLLLLEICDNGPGMPLDFFPSPGVTSVSGRGLRMIDRFSDSLFVGSPGGCLIILKTIEGDSYHAD